MDDLSRFCCLNSDCPEHGKRDAGNLTICHRYGPGGARRMLRCRACKARFSERKGTPLFGSHLQTEKALLVLHHIAEGNGVRKTGRLVGVNRATVARYGRKAGAHAAGLHDELVAVSPRTRQAQFDEKWGFVAKKEANCDRDDPADGRKGDHWDHVALDPDHRLVLSVVTGKRTAEKTVALVRDFHRRTSGRLMDLITTDEYAPYRGAILEAYGETVRPPHSGKRGRPRKAYKVPPAGLTYATVHKTRAKGRAVKVEQRIIFGTAEGVVAALARSSSSRAVNTSFVERQNGTDRNRNARKVRRSCCFSKDWSVHRAITYYTMYSYNFCWPVRTLRIKREDGIWQRRTPAMAAGLADHVWPLSEWLTLPAVHQK